ncbi:MAG: acyltransferase domain-containing protein, partial [Waterburya sp.]
SYSQLVEASKNQAIPITMARLGFVAASVDEAINKLQKGIDCLIRQPQAAEWKHPQGIFYRQTGLELQGKVVALFSGQGSQYLNMGRELAMNFPCLRETYHDLDRLFTQAGLEAISQQVFPAPTFNPVEEDNQAQTLQQTEIAQPAIAGLSVGLYKILQQAGFKPDFLVGHSFGELTALWAAQVLSDEDYFFLVKERSQAMAAKPNAKTGAMLAVQGDVTKIEAAIASFEQITIANYNSPQQLVLAGIKSEITRVQEILQQQGYSTVLLPVSAAFHTPLVGHAQEPFACAIDKVTFNPPQIPVFTNVTSNPYPFEPEASQKILKNHLFNQVQFKDQIENIYAGGGFCFVEFGPRRILTNFVTEILGDRPHLAVALNSSRQQDSDRQLREAVVQLRVAGLSLNNLDPYQLEPKPQVQPNKALNVRLSSVNYTSEKTKMINQALQNGHQHKSPSVAQANGDKVTSLNGHSANGHSAKNGHSANQSARITMPMPTAARNGHSQEVQTDSQYLAIPTQPETNYQRVLSSLEYRLSQFSQHQRETLEVHKLYLNHQTQYAQTFFQLMQQQNNLWANMSTVPEAIQNQTQIISSTERSLIKFQEHQSDTLRIHEQYLNHQGEYAQNLLQLTQQSYAQLLTGVALEQANPITTETRSISEIKEPLLTTSEPELQIVPAPISTANNDGHTNGYNNPEAIELSPTAHSTIAQTPQPDSSSLTVATPSTPVTIDVASLSQTLLDVVSDKTGYPTEMLELEMDLEADLGIDSIKRVEILGALQEEMPDLPQPNLEELAELRTLQQIIDYLHRAGDTESKSEPTISQVTPAVALPDETQKKTPSVSLTANSI